MTAERLRQYKNLKEEIKEFVDGHYGMPDTERLFPVVQEAVQHKMKRQIELAGVKKIRVHDIRHPYVKHTTKKYNSEKQKTQATKIDLIAWVFRFCIFNYSKRSWTL